MKPKLPKPRKPICASVDPDDYSYFRLILRKRVGVEIERIVREARKKDILS